MRIHPESQCAGEFCCVHNPSEHHMKTWPLSFRYDRNCLAERQCEHRIGHPDPDSLAWLRRTGVNDEGTHGCDGCCAVVRTAGGEQS